MKRFFIYRPKQAPPSFDGDPRGEMSRDNCSIMDREQQEPNPEHPGYKRCKAIESGLLYLDAYPKCKKLNEENDHGLQTSSHLSTS